MYDGDKAVLTMVQYLKEDREKDENIYEATVIEYQKEMEQVHLILRSGSLSDISLDAVYECRVWQSDFFLLCPSAILYYQSLFFHWMGG